MGGDLHLSASEPVHAYVGEMKEPLVIGVLFSFMLLSYNWWNILYSNVEGPGDSNRNP